MEDAGQSTEFGRSYTMNGAKLLKSQYKDKEAMLIPKLTELSSTLKASALKVKSEADCLWEMHKARLAAQAAAEAALKAAEEAK